jgi:membrane protein DedA with SNARE-associated domain
MVAGIRGVMVVAAGTIRYNFVKFIIADGLGAIVSGGLFVALGYWAGSKFGDLNALRAKIKSYEHWVFIGAAVLVGGFVLIKWYRRRQHKPHLTDVALHKAAKTAEEHPIKQPADVS